MFLLRGIFCLQDAIIRGSASISDVDLFLKIASTPVIGWVCKALPFIRERVMGNPRFLQVLLIEEIIGVSAKMAAEVQGRGEQFWQVDISSFEALHYKQK